MREAGCAQVLVGLESPVSAGLDGVELRRTVGRDLGFDSDRDGAIAAFKEAIASGDGAARTEKAAAKGGSADQITQQAQLALVRGLVHQQQRAPTAAERLGHGADDLHRQLGRLQVARGAAVQQLAEQKEDARLALVLGGAAVQLHVGVHQQFRGSAGRALQRLQPGAAALQLAAGVGHGALAFLEPLHHGLGEPHGLPHAQRARSVIDACHAYRASEIASPVVRYAGIGRGPRRPSARGSGG